MRLYRIDYPKILWGIVLLSLPFAMPRAAEAEPTRKETARQVGLALSQADAPTRQEAVKKQLAAFSELYIPNLPGPTGSKSPERFVLRSPFRQRCSPRYGKALDLSRS